MKVSLLKVSRKKEVIKRLELREIAEMIRENPEKDKVFNLRLKYQFYKPPEPKLERTVYMSADQFIRGQVPETFFYAESAQCS